MARKRAPTPTFRRGMPRYRNTNLLAGVRRTRSTSTGGLDGMTAERSLTESIRPGRPGCIAMAGNATSADRVKDALPCRIGDLVVGWSGECIDAAGACDGSPSQNGAIRAPSRMIPTPHRSTADFPPAGHRLSGLEPAWLRHLQQRVLVAYEVFAIGQPWRRGPRRRKVLGE